MGCQSTIKTKEELATQFNRDICKTIFNSLPERKDIDLQKLKEIIKSNTLKCSQKEKFYIIYLWICENIDYDDKSFFAGKFINCTPEYVFKKGKTVCTGYSRLFRDIALFLDLNAQCIKCFSKGFGYEPGKKLTKLNHEYNLINIDSMWFPVDLTWGAGHFEGKKFIKQFNELFFCINPELLIQTHFPENEKWQLTKRIHTLDEFLKKPQINTNFFEFNFNKYSPEEGFIILKDKNMQKFIIWNIDMKNKNASCKIYFADKKSFKQLLNCDMINYFTDRFEVDCIFNKKGKYKVELYGNKDGSPKTYNILTYIIIVEKNMEKELKFPLYYNESKQIKIFEPLYNDLKSGDKVKFKIKSDLDKIIIADEQWHYLNKDANGFFETEIIIKNRPGQKIIIGKENENKENTCVFMASYNVS